MATVLLSAAGAAVGGTVGGTLAGLSSVAIGRAVGATLGRMVDQRLLGQGGQAVETGKVDRFRLTRAGEGEAIAQLYGRMRLGGQVIWASDFQESVTVSGGGKGSRPTPETTEYSYAVSLAIALCEGEITSVGRIWADGEEIAPNDLNLRVYNGTPFQQPDPTMEAIEGVGQVPAYRGTAYVVMENLSLERFGNRVPQFSFEVMRPEQPQVAGREAMPAFGIEGVALIPGTGEYSLATTPVTYVEPGQDARWSANVNTPTGQSDFTVSLEAMNEEMQNLKAASLVVSWFGDDLRCGECTVRPKVEDAVIEGENMPWQVAGIARGQAEVIVRQDERPIYGGTPTDQSVIEAIEAMHAAGTAVMFYPFILMDQLEGNDLADPYSDADTQPHLPWRGRMTLSEAPGRPGSPDGTAAADAEVDAFFGTVVATDFAVGAGEVAYTGPQEWSLSRFILHYAALCAAAGGVDSFCISSEMRGLTQIRGAGGGFVAVARLRGLAAQVRALVGPGTKISYAADWSEYFGYQPQDGSGDRYFHLDPLWADENVDFIGIDNYMPLSDWREEDGHIDGESHDAIYDLAYLKSNIEGGEGYDWYYHSVDARAAQIRTEITDGAHDEPWIYRYKDIRNWWANAHHERINGVRQAAPTDWVPESKPIWFTEYGCAAIDKGTNQPNKFLDVKSSESALPRYSTGARDDLMQMQYLRAMAEYWNDPANNPVSPEYGGRMLDMARAFVWAWDVRPFPAFPNNHDLWNDGANYGRGHWVNGRTSARPLASVVGEICRRAGLEAFSTEGLYGYVRGYAVEQVTDARAALQPLMIRYGFDAIERDGVLQFRMRDGQEETVLDPETFAISGDLDGVTEQVREADAEISGRVRLRFVQADGNFDTIAEEAVLADEATHAVSASELNMALTRAEGRQVVERWLTEARVSRERIRLALPPSRLALGAGDVIEVPGEGNEGPGRYRIDRVEQTELQLIEAVRIEPEVFEPADIEEDLASLRPFVPPVPVVPFFLDLPLLRGDEVPHAPYIAATAAPWPGAVAVYQSSTDENYALNTILPRPSIVGRTQNAMTAASAGVWDRGAALEVKIISGALSSVTEEALLSGANLAAIGDGASDIWEVFQFAEAELVAPGTYWLRTRLRGQAGTDGVMPAAWPAGSVFVLLDGTPSQITQSPNLRRVAQNYRIGPARRGYDDPSYRHLTRAFDGIGLRPYSPCQVQANPLPNGSVDLQWVRRTRRDGDAWDGLDVPLGEESEHYLVRVMVGSEILRETSVNAPHWRYEASARAADGTPETVTFAVAQVSASFGAGPFATLGYHF
ncbi:glycoside hydrolase/phage tail family protein [Sulfitobacter sp. TSTF-M16]|uniref:Glycoside hydrolase/phage tail family protein n=1 Tax=Sulfitobacter aestuariivivens TaxID=2766981 RepID=A0A927D2Y6_9RHOB|nr:glycoside hydrolase/phage tail family protein [Sulfitobacter aestuariivivens]MBD3662939.1 glycoside hydrolase/phage tail family protein [Sulfitobacter aestuariivivens]